MIRKKHIKNLIRILLTIFFIVIVINIIDFKILAECIKNYPMLYFLFAFIVALLVNVVGTFSLYSIYRKDNIVNIFIVTLKSNFYAMILPGQMLGETTKLFMLSSEQSSMGERASSIIIDKLLNMIALAVIGCIGIFMSPNINNTTIKGYLFIGMCLILILFLLLKNVRILRLVLKILRLIIKNDRIYNKIKKYLDIWIDYANQNRNLVISGIWGIIYQIMISLSYYILSKGLGLTVSYWDFCWINAILTVLLFLPISIGGLGIRETSLIGFLGMLGVASEMAVVISIMMLIICILRAAIGGVLLLTEKKEKKNDKAIGN